jgi:hypothetical protein
MTKVFEIDGLEELEQLPESLGKAAVAYGGRAMDKACAALVGAQKEYPPATEANQPGRYSLKTHRPMGYYERGRGWWYPIMGRETIELAGRYAAALAGGSKARFGKSRGVIKAAKMQRKMGIAGYKLRAVSEQLGRSFAWHTEVKDGIITGFVGNNASYTLPVVGPASDQARLMQKRGWRNVEQALDIAGPAIDFAFHEMLDELVALWKKPTASMNFDGTNITIE